jgi:hypothetical protein
LESVRTGGNRGEKGRKDMGVATTPKKNYIDLMGDAILRTIIFAVVLYPFYYLFVPRKREFGGRTISQQELQSMKNTGGAIYMIILLVVFLSSFAT